jgi:hypothetical protein
LRFQISGYHHKILKLDGLLRPYQQRETKTERQRDRRGGEKRGGEREAGTHMLNREIAADLKMMSPDLKNFQGLLP